MGRWRVIIDAVIQDMEPAMGDRPRTERDPMSVIGKAIFDALRGGATPLPSLKKPPCWGGRQTSRRRCPWLDCALVRPSAGELSAARSV